MYMQVLTMSSQNMIYQRYLNRMKLPLCSKQNKKLNLYMKYISCNAIPMQRHLSFSVPTKHLSSWGDLFKSCFPLLFTTLVLNDSWTGGILNAQYLLLYCTPSK